MEPDAVRDRSETILNEVERAVIVDRSVLRSIMVGLMADGHVLLEDVPGTGKTLTARSMADALGLTFSRIQFTPDLLPSDVTGSNVLNEKTREFEFQHGPIFANVVLADEINRSPPKTQAALLEAMEEGQVTVDGETHALPDPFIVLATQNPVEMDGTFELPVAQKDRFMLKTSLGYPDYEGELELIDRRADRDTQSPTVRRVSDPEIIDRLRQAPETVRVEPAVREYLVTVARETRADERVSAGVSPRGVQRFFEAVRANAILEGRSYATPDDVKVVAQQALSHRLVLTPDARVEQVDAADVVRTILSRVEVPQLNARSNGR
ncbi:MoxR family ATPase [Natronomonas salina]|uniref:AAA family ATPase n=1 Tax=Natronomonas salina TaxID=1710540 RepID=UPI0015B47094|nr:MoxR family ATPase [Natronomonas salina]QLD90444.1 MoxR family ATPase [Natronomonas salina]